MKLHKITLPVRGDGLGDNVFAHAAALARQHKAHVEVLHCTAQVQDLMGYGVVIPRIVKQQIEAAVASGAAADEAGLRDEFRDLAQTLRLAEQAPEAGKATTEFIEYKGKQADAVRHYGRISDLICVPQPDKKRRLGANTLKSALYSSGRPVMMCPPRDAAPGALGSHVCIGWNGSLEATRAVAQTTALIHAAEQVTLLTTGREIVGAGVEDLARYLSQRGVAVTISRFQKTGTIGRDLLNQTRQVGGDLLVMGAYHESYERETIFGGNTQAVVDEADFPVVLVH